MTGILITKGRWLKLAAVLSAVTLVSACEEAVSTAVLGDQSGPMITRGEQDVERPDIFEATDRGLWDGRPSLGGIWVAHPDVRDPERVVIRNVANGQSTIGALFRRERANPGPALQLSSDAAEALGILAGAPTELSVVALRREEVVAQAEPAADADLAPLATPAEIAAAELEPAAAPAATQPVAVALPPAAPAPPDSGQPPATLAQVGIFGVQGNADAAAATLQSAGFTASVIPLQSAGRQTWRVVAGPVPDQVALARLRALGFPDAYILQNPT
ncbi:MULTISPECIES: SPOR domain-containing protein [unclassified Yoonia]|uniref:SPOR domain-containing protein n=1 Tax=unclassified Yoonia TaxID=2629118 RepID=UPI002AFEC7D6|nr:MULTISPECIES: SPOR domain-containing protein [unclassified Yoonia]